MASSVLSQSAQQGPRVSTAAVVKRWIQFQTWAQISNEMRFSFRPTSPARDEVRVVSLPVLPGRHSPLLNAPLRRSPARARLSFPEPSRSLVLLLLTSAAPVAGYPLRRRRRCDLSTRSLPWFARFGSDQAGSLVCGDSRRSAFSRPFGGLIWDWGVDADLPSGIHWIARSLYIIRWVLVGFMGQLVSRASARSVTPIQNRWFNCSDAWSNHFPFLIRHTWSNHSKSLVQSFKYLCVVSSVHVLGFILWWFFIFDLFDYRDTIFGQYIGTSILRGMIVWCNVVHSSDCLWFFFHKCALVNISPIYATLLLIC